MFPDFHDTPYLADRGLLRPDRRPLPRAAEIRLRVKRTTSRAEA